MRILFGPFTLDTEARQLLRGADERHLTAKAFDLLEALVRARPRALAKPRHLEVLWPDTFVVEANLSNLVAELRAALEDDARSPRYVRTVYGHGYAFSAPAHQGEPATPERLPDGSSCVAIDGRPRLLRPGENVIGRARDAAIWIDSEGVSRRHAVLRVTGASAVLEDLGSKNGTWLRGERLRAPTPVDDGDEIRVGSVRLVYHRSLLDAATRTAS
jgi:DNA-binding winged helix-turn-helix (wHTH) protein